MFFALIAIVGIKAEELDDSTSFEWVSMEMSLSSRFHGTTPITSSIGLDFKPRKICTMFSFGYQYMLETVYSETDKNYRDAHGLYGSLGLIYKKLPVLRFKYTHSIGRNEFKYSMYDVGLQKIYGVTALGVGYRIIKSPTAGVRDYSGVYFSLRIAIGPIKL